MQMRRGQGLPVRRRRARTQVQPATEAPAILEPVWLFDLDNTLHDTSHKIFPLINVGMTQAVMESLGVDQDTANALRTRYWKRYGATLLGMVRHHGIDPHAFLHRSHDFEVAPLIRAEKGLATRLAKLPGRKVLVTNAPLHYARAVLSHLGLLRCFSAIWAIEHMRLHGHFRPKPSVSIMRHILAHEGVSPRRAILVEDTLANLRGARRAGIRTVHVAHPATPFATQRRGRPDFVDLRVNSITDLLGRRRPVRGL